MSICYGGFFKTTIMKRLYSDMIVLLKNNNFNKTIFKNKGQIKKYINTI